MQKIPKKGTFEFRFSNLLLALCIVASTALSIVSSFLLGNFVDFLSGRPSFDRATWLYILAILGILFFTAVFHIIFANFLPLKVLLNKSISYSQDVMREVLHLSQRDYQRKDKGYYMNLVVSSAFTCGDLYAQKNVEFVGNVLCVLLLIVVAARVSVWFSLVYVIYIPLFIFLTWEPNKRLTSFQKAGLPTQDAFLGGTKKIVEDKRAINIARAESYFEVLYKKRSEKYLSFLTKLKWYLTLSTNLPNVLASVLTAVTLGVAAKLYFDGGMTIGTILVMFQLSQVLQNPLNRCLEIILYCSMNVAHIERLHELSAQEQNPTGYEQVFQNLDCLAKIPAGKVFSTPERERELFSVSRLTLPKNKLILVKGKNGTGKSTLTNLLTGFADIGILDGSIALDGALAQASYLCRPILFVDGDVAENMFGKKMNQKACDVLGIPFLDRQINESGSNLSLGEQQKLGLLRQLSSDAEVVVLDEPFANLDRDSIGRLAKYLSELKQKKSVIAIVHSHELDAFADIILEIHDGKLVCTPPPLS